MSQDEREQILAELLVIRRLLGWAAGGIFTVLAALGLVVTNDHFDQRSLRETSDWMRPKVERLWYKHMSPEELDAASLPSAALPERPRETAI